MFRIKNISHLRFKSALNLSLILLAVAILGFVLMPRGTHAGGYVQQFEKLNRLVQTSNGSEGEGKLFREGRDLIGDEEWDKAAVKFREVIAKYPKGKDTDAALYWLSFALKKLEKYQQADATLQRLIADYPASRWKDDANTMRAELAVVLADRPAVTSIDKYDDETKIVVLQSIFQGNAERGAAIAVDILKTDSKAGRRLKEAAITLLGQHRSKAGLDLLVGIVRNETDLQLRKTAVFWLGQTGDEGVLDLLKEMAGATDTEFSKAAVFSISQHSSPRAAALLVELARNGSSRKVREEAIFWVGQRGGPSAEEELIR